MRAHASLRLGNVRGTTPELLGSYRGSVCLLSVAPCVAFGALVWPGKRDSPPKTSSPSTQRWNGRAFASLTARGGGLPVGVISFSLFENASVVANRKSTVGCAW